MLQLGTVGDGWCGSGSSGGSLCGGNFLFCGGDFLGGGNSLCYNGVDDGTSVGVETGKGCVGTAGCASSLFSL